MPDTTHTDRIRSLLQEARGAADAMSSALGEIEAELAALEQESQALDFEVPVDQEEPITFTQEEAEIMLLKMLLTVQEAAFLLGAKPTEVYRMISAGELPVFKIGRAVRIPVKQLKEYIQAARADEGKGEVPAPGGSKSSARGAEKGLSVRATVSKL